MGFAEKAVIPIATNCLSSFVLALGEVFCDSGSRCYTRSAELRNLDRSTRAHNTLMVDGSDQNIVPTDPGLLFWCGNDAGVSPIALSEGGTAVRASHHGYSRIGIEHHRTVQLTQGSLLVLELQAERDGKAFAGAAAYLVPAMASFF